MHTTVDGSQAGSAAAVATFEQARPALFGIAYRVTRSHADAEDVLQEAFIRWRAVDHAVVQSPPAFLARTVTRLALNAQRMAHRRRIDYTGLAPSEPVGDATPLAAALGDADVERREEVSGAMRRVLSHQTPVERAVLILHGCFGYAYVEIATLIGKSEENCRQIDRRARLRLSSPRSRYAVSPHAHQHLVTLFLAAARSGDLQPLLEGLTSAARDFSARN